MIAVAIAAVVGLFIVLSGDDDEPAPTTTAATTTTQKPSGNGEKPEKPGAEARGADDRRQGRQAGRRRPGADVRQG